MHKQTLIALAKRYPFAMAITALYTFCWLWLLYVGYHDFTNYGDGETIGMSIFGALIVFFAPYFITTLLLASLHRTQQAFYLKLCYFSIVPVVINLLWVAILDSIY